MPNRFAMRQLALNYEDEVQKQIVAFYKQNVQYDYLDGNRDISLEMTLNESEFLYSANDKIKGMAQSGDLQRLHAKCNELESVVETGYLKVVDHLDRAVAQIAQTEEDIYQGLDSVDRLRSHNSNSITDALSLSAGSVSLENYLIVEGAAQKNPELAGQANTLKQLIGARAWILMARVHLLEEFVDKVGKTDSAAKAELRQTRTERDAYANAYNGDCSQVTGDAKIFKEQVDDLRRGELASLFKNMNEHD